MSNSTRYVLYTEEDGIYLGSCMGMGFWSKVDPVGQSAACTFESESQIREIVAEWEWKPQQWRAVQVEPDDGLYASIAACERAGLPGWDTTL